MRIRRILEGKSGFHDQMTGEDLFAGSLGFVMDVEAQDLYREITRELFQGSGALEIWEIKSAEGELGLRISAGEGKKCPYFGVINIGDVSAFKKHVEETLQIEIQEDKFTPSLFLAVNSSDSRVNILIGSKKFIEGWSSWRVSSMGLLNMGKGEGPQVIQLFGRGVRLKGKGGSLKRSSFLPEEGPHPEGIEQIEQLHIFGWNADYIQSFRKMLEQEDLGREFRIPVRVQHRLWPKLPVPRPKKGYSANWETWALSKEPLHVQVDMTPQVYALRGKSLTSAQASRRRLVDFAESSLSCLLDMDALFLSLVHYKEARGYDNILLKKTEFLPILRSSELTLAEDDMRNPKVLLEGAAQVLRVYLDRFAAASEREAEGLHLEPSTLSFVCESMIPYYSVRLPSSAKDLIDEVEDLLHKPTRLYSDGGKPLPRLHLDEHLFTPLLESPEDYRLEGVSVSPPGLRKGEAILLRDLREFWTRSHEEKGYKDMTVYLLRNLPRVGVGFFKKSGFFPDFIMWLKEKGVDCTTEDSRGIRIRWTPSTNWKPSAGSDYSRKER